MDNVYALKPVNWLKASMMVLIGIINTRFGVGVGRVNTNIFFGMPIFFLVAISGMLVVLALKNVDEDAARRKKTYRKIGISSAVFFLVAFGLSLFHTFFYNLDILNVFLLAFLGIFGFVSFYYGKEWDKRGFLANFIIGLSFSFGIIYGAALNGIDIPIFIYLFFGAAFLLQFSKDLMNDSKFIERDEREGFKSFAISLGTRKAMLISLISEILTILFLVLPIIPGFQGIFNPFLYTIPMILTVSIIGIAVVFTALIKEERTYYRIVKIILRIAMFLLFVVLIFASL